MNKKISLVLLGSFVLVSVAVYMLVSRSGNDVTEVNTSSIMSDVQDADKIDNQVEEPIVEARAGQYIDYSSEQVTNTKGKRVLFFHAPWCSLCNDLDKNIKNGVIPTDVTIFKTDFDSNQKLRQQYGVTIQTTFILLDDSGKLVKKYVASEDLSFESLLDNLL